MARVTGKVVSAFDTKRGLLIQIEKDEFYYEGLFTDGPAKQLHHLIKTGDTVSFEGPMSAKEQPCYFYVDVTRIGLQLDGQRHEMAVGPTLPTKRSMG